jgi:uncharacterized protein YndB with AHSA1/START domain
VTEISVDIDLSHPPDRVWRALTDHQLISSWFLPTDLEPRQGAVFRAFPGHASGFTGPFDIEVVGVDEARSLRMQWRGDQLHAHVAWEIEPAPGGSRLIVRQTGFLGVNGTLRRRELRRAYQEMFEERLPVALDRIARVVTDGLDNELPSAASPKPPEPGFDDPSDPWALSDPLVAAGVVLPMPDREEESAAPARPSLLRRLTAAFPLEERVRAAVITITVALVAATVGWLWLTRPNNQDRPPMHYPQSTGPAVGEQPGVILPSGVLPSADPSGPRASGGPSGGSSAPVGPNPGTSGGPQASGSPPPVVLGNQPLTAAYATKSSTGLVGYKVVVIVTIHNPGDVARSGWIVVLTVPSGADIQDSSSSVSTQKDGGMVTITPQDAARTVNPYSEVVFTITFSGSAVLGIGSGGVTDCTIDGAACKHS